MSRAGRNAARTLRNLADRRRPGTTVRPSIVSLGGKGL
ncbi:hypothetical protein J2X65_003587 [Ancylobacter sp. 3268]|nr:hypothetical protein [Ancylobacter sp. 3268]